ncbi:hypothetical protein [Hyphococcus sp.]|uniref:hypothetical protein n=1 Tax=Hyphococcus sp. TaxID=2038636 RepID=UPI003CCC0075
MQLTKIQIKTVEKKTDLTAVSQDNAAIDKLQNAFGNHTYFMNEDGLFIFMRAKKSDTTAHLLAFAMWDEDDDNKLLQLAEPMNAGIALDLENTQIQDNREAARTIH